MIFTCIDSLNIYNNICANGIQNLTGLEDTLSICLDLFREGKGNESNEEDIINKCIEQKKGYISYMNQEDKYHRNDNRNKTGNKNISKNNNVDHNNFKNKNNIKNIEFNYQKIDITHNNANNYHQIIPNHFSLNDNVILWRTRIDTFHKNEKNNHIVLNIIPNNRINVFKKYTNKNRKVDEHNN